MKDWTIKIDPSRDELLTEFGKKTLEERYLLPGETYQECFARAAKAYGSDEAHAQRLYDYASKQWFMFSSPILANAGTERGYPISCFLNYVPDSIEGLCAHSTENRNFTVRGGGIGSYWGHVRSANEPTSKGSETPGPIPFIHTSDSDIIAYAQGKMRRGAEAVYMDITHPDIEEFIELRDPENTGDLDRKSLNLHHGVCIPDAFMHSVKKGEDIDLIDPHSKEVKKQISARSLWEKILETRMRTGEPYLAFTDTINNALPNSLKARGLRVHHSNLCSEITLPTNEDRSAVCCLSSMNLATYAEWDNILDDVVGDVIEMLDNVLTNFVNQVIATGDRSMRKAIKSVMAERSLGLGRMGLHTFLQKVNVPFNSDLADTYRVNIAFQIQQAAIKRSRSLSKERGAYGDFVGGYSQRNSHLLATAPNAKSSIICGEVSPSCEPWSANAFTYKTDTGFSVKKNEELRKVLKFYDKDTPEIWDQIITDNGSVQGLAFLSGHEKDVFKTAFELDQTQLVEAAALEQPHICQSQSINLFFKAGASKASIHKAHWSAWEEGLKTLYYCRSSSTRRAEDVTKPIAREVRSEVNIECTDDVCVSCEG